MTLELTIKIILAILPFIFGIVGYFAKNWINGLVKSMTNLIAKLSKDLEDIKSLQKTQDVTMTKIQMDLQITKQMVEQTQKHVDDHGSRLREIEISHAAIAQWKKDNENGKF